MRFNYTGLHVPFREVTSLPVLLFLCSFYLTSYTSEEVYIKCEEVYIKREEACLRVLTAMYIFKYSHV